VTKVSFYVLPEGDGGNRPRLLFGCRLADKAMKQALVQKQHVYIHCDDGDLSGVDDLLWTFKQGSFVAHERAGDVTDTQDCAPVIIGTGEPPAGIDGTLINLTDEVPAFFSRFERVAEIIDHAGKETGRKRYQFYKDRGYPLETHKMEAGQA
jgi:DNA polymerase-3 subunit chi